jgi:hypothetical protein
MSTQSELLTPQALSLLADKIAERLRDRSPASQKWMTPQETADHLRLSVRGLEDLRSRGEGPPYSRVNHRIVRYRIADVDAWLLSHGGGHG